MLNVEGRKDLVRDPSSGAILNIDTRTYNAAVKASKDRELARKQLEDNTNDINSIKGELSEIKMMMRQLLGSLNNDGR